MEKKFKDYYIEGLKNSFKTLYKRKRNLFKFYVCLFIYILSIPLFIFKPVINLGIFRLANQINEDNDIDLTSLTKPCDNPKNFFTALFAGVVKILIIIGIIMFWIAIAGVLAGIGLIIMKFTESNDYSIVLLFASPALLVILIYLIMIPIMYVEIGYIVNNNNDINASNAINISFNAYKNEGKKERFLIIFINCLILVSYLVIFGIIAALPIIIDGYSSINLGITLLIIVLVFIPFSMLSPLFVLGTISSITLLNDDVVKDTLTDVVSVTNVKFHLPNKNIDDLTVEEKLAYIFDKSDDLKPNIKDLRILDSLDIVDNDGNYISSDSKKDEKTIENDLTKKVEINSNISEEKGDIKIEENIDSIDQNNDEIEKEKTAADVEDIEDINETINEELTNNLENNNELNYFTDEEPSSTVNLNNINDSINEEPILEEISEPKEVILDEITENNEIIDNNETIIEENEDPILENETDLNESINNNEENLLEDEKLEVEEIPSNDFNTDEVIDNINESNEEAVLENVEDIINPKEEIKEEEFDMDLFNEESKENDESLEELLKKGDE